MTARPRAADLALAGAFLAVHGLLTAVGVLVVPAEAFHDLELYRWWVATGLQGGGWPVLDGPWVYPVGALVPMLLPVLVAASTAGYATAWCALVTLLDAVAVVALVRRGAAGRRAAWWWLAFLTLLGPVAIGRLDGVLAPLLVLGVLLGLQRPALAASVLTLGAWIKVVPGALLLPVAAAARRWRAVVVPGAAVTAVVVLAVAAGGGLPHVASFASTQGERGLQVESVAATPWVVAAAAGSTWRGATTTTPPTGVPEVVLDEALVTYEVRGPGTGTAGAVLSTLLPLAVLAVGVVLLVARRRGRAGDAYLPAALTLVLLLVVTNKVGSPQFMTWLAAPVTAALAVGAVGSAGAARSAGVVGSAGAARSAGVVGSAGAAPSTRVVGSERRRGPVADGVRRRSRRAWLVVAVASLAVAALTQALFPWTYLDLLVGAPLPTAVLAVRNALLLGLTAVAGTLLVRAVTGPEVAAPTGADRSAATTSGGRASSPGEGAAPPAR